MKYTTLDKNGLPTAFYSDDIHSNIPKEAIEITEDQWLECINNSGKRKFENGLLIEPIYIPTAEQLQQEVSAEAKAYLVSTDWYVVRQTETGVAIPLDIAQARSEARLKIVGA